MNYKKIYNTFVSSRKSLSRSKKRGSFSGYEYHHNNPDFLYKNRKRKGPHGHIEGDPDDPDNIVLLTYREHVFAHLVLLKIYEGTRYEYSCNSALMLMLREDSELRGRKSFNDLFKNRKQYENIRTAFAQSISNLNSGMMPVKDVLTGEMIGSVAVGHPNVVSGKWVHHSKGRNLSKSHKKKISERNTGTSNGNSNGYSDQDLKDSHVECCLEAGFIVPRLMFNVWASKNDKPNVLHYRSFRLEGRGFAALTKNSEKITGYVYDQKFYLKKSTRETYKQFKEKLTDGN